MIKLGFSRERITPKLPIELSGYYPLRFSNLVHDHLWVRTHAYIETKPKKILIFSTFDLSAVDQQMHKEISRELAIKYPSFEIDLYISATHTHSGPAGILDTSEETKQSLVSIFGELNEDYYNYCVEKCLDTILDAIASSAPFKYKILIDDINDVGKNRHDIRKVGDSSLLVLEFTLDNGNTSLLYFYSCHPTVLNRKNNKISADLPWGVSRLLEKNPYAVVQFINGNSGDISTRFTRKTSSFNQVVEFGEQMVNTISKVSKQRSQRCEKIKVYSDNIELKTKSPEDTYLKIMDVNVLENTKTLTLRYSFIQIDKLIFVTIPGEITYQLIQPLKEQFPNLFVMGYTNDYLFYFASSELYESNEYEAKSSFLRKGEIERAISKIYNQLEEIK